MTDQVLSPATGTGTGIIPSLHRDSLRWLDAHDFSTDERKIQTTGNSQITFDVTADIRDFCTLNTFAREMITRVHDRLQAGTFDAFIEFPHRVQLFSGNDPRNRPTYNNIQIVGIFRGADGTMMGQKRTSIVLLDGGSWVLTKSGSIYVMDTGLSVPAEPSDQEKIAVM